MQLTAACCIYIVGYYYEKKNRFFFLGDNAKKVRESKTSQINIEIGNAGENAPRQQRDGPFKY